jgi:hypothetical protein
MAASPGSPMSPPPPQQHRGGRRITFAACVLVVSGLVLGWTRDHQLHSTVASRVRLSEMATAAVLTNDHSTKRSIQRGVRVDRPEGKPRNTVTRTAQTRAAEPAGFHEVCHRGLQPTGPISSIDIRGSAVVDTNTPYLSMRGIACKVSAQPLCVNSRIRLLLCTAATHARLVRSDLHCCITPRSDSCATPTLACRCATRGRTRLSPTRSAVSPQGSSLGSGMEATFLSPLRACSDLPLFCASTKISYCLPAMRCEAHRSSCQVQSRTFLGQGGRTCSGTTVSATCGCQWKTCVRVDLLEAKDSSVLIFWG